MDGRYLLLLALLSWCIVQDSWAEKGEGDQGGGGGGGEAGARGGRGERGGGRGGRERDAGEDTPRRRGEKGARRTGAGRREAPRDVDTTGGELSVGSPAGEKDVADPPWTSIPTQAAASGAMFPWGSNTSMPLSLPHPQYGIQSSKSVRKPDDVQVYCKELRSKRFISDGFCTSVKPITEVVCTGHCLPIRDLPWYAEFIKVWSRSKLLEWRCEDAEVRRRKVHLQCENGETRTYRIKVVKSCTCKRYLQLDNKSTVRFRGRGRRKNRRKKKKQNFSSGNPDRNGAEL